MITKYKIFEDLEEDIDPYGEERWSDVSIDDIKVGDSLEFKLAGQQYPIIFVDDSVIRVKDNVLKVIHVFSTQFVLELINKDDITIIKK